MRKTGWWAFKNNDDSSYVWKSVSVGLHTLKDKDCWLVGDGTSIRLGQDLWVPYSP